LLVLFVLLVVLLLLLVLLLLPHCSHLLPQSRTQ